MSDEMKMERAKKVYNTLCTAIDKRDWTYDREDEDLIVRFNVSGEDIPMSFILIVDADRQLVRLLSPIPFNMGEDKRMDGAIATCVASYGFINGSFDYDLEDGSIVFRLTQSFRGSDVSEEVLQYMISLSCSVVDNYNDRFMALNKGLLSITDFIAKEG